MFWKDTVQQMKRQATDLEKNVCKNTYLIKDWCQEYIKNSHKSVVRKKWPNH